MIEPTYNYPLDSDNTAKRKAKNVDTTSQNTAEASNMPGLGAMEKARVWINMAGAEETGIERITDEMRSEQKPRDLFTLFFSGNVNTATLALGYLGPTVYGMGWWDSFLTILFFNLVGCIFPSAVAVFGPKLGLRTMIIPRYSFGWWPAKVLAFLNVVNQIGWAVVNCISGSSVLYDVGDGRLPLAVAVFLIGTLASILSCLGYKVTKLRYNYNHPGSTILTNDRFFTFTIDIPG